MRICKGIWTAADWSLGLVQTAGKAAAFYNDKVKGLDTNLQELEKIVQGKSQQLRIVEEGEFLVGHGFFYSRRNAGLICSLLTLRSP